MDGPVSMVVVRAKDGGTWSTLFASIEVGTVGVRAVFALIVETDVDSTVELVLGAAWEGVSEHEEFHIAGMSEQISSDVGERGEENGSYYECIFEQLSFFKGMFSQKSVAILKHVTKGSIVSQNLTRIRHP